MNTQPRFRDDPIGSLRDVRRQLAQGEIDTAAVHSEGWG